MGSTMTVEEIIEEIYLKIEGWFYPKQMEALYPLVKDLPKGSLLVEIGTFRGKSTRFFSLANPEIRILTIDKGRENQDGSITFIDKDVLMGGEIFQVAGRSQDVSKSFNWEIDFLFIDGDHAYQQVLHDIEQWTPHVKPLHHVAFHDYEPMHPDVINAIDKLVTEKNGFRTVVRDVKCGIFIAQVKDGGVSFNKEEN